MLPAGTRVRSFLGRPDFRRLLATRLLAQFGDGVFQAALAGTVLFNPERAADPADVAAGFAVLLLPYSLVGPFAGVWLDRWSRRSVLLRANLLRAALVAIVAALVLAGVGGPPFYLAGLAVLSVSRFVLAALSAGLPHTTAAEALVPANAVSTTAGSVATVVGGGAALGLRVLTGSGNAGYAVLALVAVLPYVVAAVVVAGFARNHLGPDAALRSGGTTARQVAAGMLAGARHVRERPAAAAVLTTISLYRLLFGVFTLMTLLLYRNTFAAAGPLFPTGLAGLAEVLAVGALGAVVAAALTPAAVARIGKTRWIVLTLTAGGVAQLALALAVTAPATVAVAFVLRFTGQAVKICVDSTLQETVDDDYRGRVFSVYDTVFNVPFVVAVVLAALVLPESGRSYPVLVAVGAGYLLTALAHRWWSGFVGVTPTNPLH